MAATRSRPSPPIPKTRPGKGGHGRLKVGGTKSKSDLTRAERRERGFKLIAKGYTNVEIAHELKCHPDTVTRMRKAYAEQVQSEAAANPHLLNEVLANTVRVLAELDLIRKEAWAAHDGGVFVDHEVECPNCEQPHEISLWRGAKGETKSQLLRILLQANDQKAKLYQLFGVKAEFMAHVNQVALLQQRLVQFMRDVLCEEDKARLEELLATITGATSANDTIAALELPSEEVA